MVFVLGLSLKLLHDTYRTTYSTKSISQLVENQDVSHGSHSRWSVFSRSNNTMDVYLEKLKHFALQDGFKQKEVLLQQEGPNEHKFNESNTGELSDKNSARTIKVHYFNKPDHVSITSFAKCPDACIMTSGVNAEFSTSDAVMFQGPLLSYSHSRPPAKTRGQIWVLHGSEAPVYWSGSLSQWRGLFNWTMSYRRDADIRHSYGDFRTKQRQAGLSTVPADSFISNLFNPVGWFVSHCATSSKRESYVKQLAKYVNIDIYGACGKLVCGFKFKECLDRYKFYLSFENAICRDYITEKVFNIYQVASNTIPVVRGFKGQAAMFLPPGSYISTDEFSSAEELSKLLLQLSTNITSFQSYFRWKHFYESYSYDPNPFCTLCRKLHQSESYRRLYNDIEAWIKGGNKEFCEIVDDMK
ncbi:Glycoprotein 3-alpha-L-fucosyltransferase A [Mizuhopecten yessoensis]|uniref:Fucosyltransferase n=2 Tax=Mizuhopecten yessoensis TaxID=6573 RepID=A0A210PEP2_MIZYE|nr:Glycoprotein 3-alpha-L-fucosyltransferase A [Mizuhopecten yessoensis]